VNGMKRGLVSLIILLLVLPIVSAIPAFPYFGFDEEGTIVSGVQADGSILTSDELEAKGYSIATQDGDHDWSLVIDKETECPVSFVGPRGERKPFFARIGDDGYPEPDEGLPFVPRSFTPETAETEGLTCGVENLQQILPLRPRIPRRPLNEMHNNDRLRANANRGFAVKEQDGYYQPKDPRLVYAIEQGYVAPPTLPPPPPIITGAAVAAPTELNILVLLVQFPDQKATASVADIEEKFFGEGGLADYFNTQSYGVLTISGDVIPTWYTLAEDMGYYGDNYEANVEDMIVGAIGAADADIDFSDYDTDGDGIIDGFFVVHAGEPDENGGGNNEEIWSHYYSITPETADGVKIIDYETVSEDSPIGIVAHEFGHYLGLPDFYDTVVDDGSSKGTGEWSIMGYGGYLADPGSFDPWSKDYLNWLDEESLVEVTDAGYYDVSQDNSVYGTKYYLLRLSEQEYYLVENRRVQKLMNGGEAGGVLIWHIDEAVLEQSGSWNGCKGTRWDCNTVNGDADNKLVDLVEAGDQNLDQGDLGDSDDPWYKKCSTFGGCQQYLFYGRSTPASSGDVVVGAYSDVASTMQLAAALDGTVPEETTEEEGVGEVAVTVEGEEVSAAAGPGETNLLLYVIVGLVVVVVIGVVAAIFMRKRGGGISPTQYKSFSM